MSRRSSVNFSITRADYSLLKALYITVGVFLSLFTVAHIVSALYASSLLAKENASFQDGISQDMAHLQREGNTIAKDERIVNALLSKNMEGLLAILQEERIKRSIGLMGVTDERGIILSRTKSVNRLGDNVFLTTPQGRAVATGKSVETIEVSGVNPTQLIMITGRPILDGSKMIGALFTNHLLDDNYATRFRDGYLSKGAEVVFYTKNYGIYGTSFSDPEKRRIIGSYFNSGSDWIQDGRAEKVISFGDGRYYTLANITFPGLEQTPGGALLFIPRQDFSGVMNFVEAAVTVVVFLVLALMYHARVRRKERSGRYYVLLSFISIFVLVFAFLTLYLQKKIYVLLEEIPYKLYNSTIRLQPELGIYAVGFEHRFSVVVDTGDEPINAVQVELTFDPETVDMQDLSTEGSACSYIVEKVIDMVAGKARLSCVILNSQTLRRSVPVAEAVVKPLRTGTFEIAFNEAETKVLANDGLGTDVLRASQGGSYRVDTFDSSVVFSPTHPNQNRWYNSSVARFVWSGVTNAVYVYEFDTSPNTVPSVNHTLQGSQIEIPVPGDGIFYFHLRLVSSDKVLHYRIRSDRTPPSITSLKTSSEKIVVGDVVRFFFDAEDVSSGVQKNYYADLGNHLFLPFGSQLAVPFLEAGNQKVILRVYDGAGNYSEQTQTIQVTPQASGGFMNFSRWNIL